MTTDALHNWMTALGYDPASPSMHHVGQGLRRRHPYAPELNDLLNPEGEIRAHAAFDVEGTPTVCFFMDDGTLLSDESALAAIRQRLWNQNLISLILILAPDRAVAVPPVRKAVPATPLLRNDARPDGPLSCADVQSGDIFARHKNWFRLEDRVDRKLLANLRETIRKLSTAGSLPNYIAPLSREDAHNIIGQILFVRYLEDRGIVGDHYRSSRKVGWLYDLLRDRDRHAIVRMLLRLKSDFNGDFLEPSAGTRTSWLSISDDHFDVLSDFLSATDMEDGQLSFWPYNFRYIPVELLSGIYEAFIGADVKRKIAAFYTPRNLANLVVDQALAFSSDLLAERIYDGACGSGILLTTAFRRVLAEAEARQPQPGIPLPLSDRIDLLKAGIFGSDISEAACRVTAFSLYLSLLERLDQSDIAALCDDEDLKLPQLRGHNLFAGPHTGDFFSENNPLARRDDFTLFICNPPWLEPEGEELTLADKWAAENKVPHTLRQLAAKFAWRATNCLGGTGRLCLILPMSLLLKPTSQSFVSEWLAHVIWQRLINFGDFKELLFDEGRKSCVVLLATPRTSKGDQQWTIPPSEEFDYWVPKADIGLASGRLTLHSSDRHRVQTQAITLSNRQLATRMWGDDFDLALWAELRLRGTFQDLFSGRNKRWVRRKGFHRTDNSVEEDRWVSSEPLWDMQFIRPTDLYDSPVVTTHGGRSFPKEEMPLVPHLGSDLLSVFQGPRILFPDGPSPDLEIRAAFSDQPGSFMSSIGVISGPAADNDLLRFATVYLRSNLVRYFMVTQLYQLLSDRDRISLIDISDFPFYLPDRHPNPVSARRTVLELAELTRQIEQAPSLMRPHRWEQVREDAETRLQSYFGLNERAQAIVRETVESVLPSIRPYGLSAVYERAARRPSDETIEAYVANLAYELESWRDSRHGIGDFGTEALLTKRERSGPYGIVRVSLVPKGEAFTDIVRKDEAARAVLHELLSLELLPISLSDQLYFSADVVIVAGGLTYIIKPQTERAWLRRQAKRDAERIVEATTRPGTDVRAVA